MTKIQRISLFFKVLFQIMLIALPVLLIMSWVYAPHELLLLKGIIKLNAIPGNYSGMHTYIPQGIPEKALLHTLSAKEKTLGCLASIIPMSINMFILFMLIKLFNSYKNADFFSVHNVKYLRNIGYALFLSQLIEPIYQFAMGIILTIHNPPHHHFASITLDQTNIGILLVAFLVILISWIMAEAYKLREEQKLTI